MSDEDRSNNQYQIVEAEFLDQLQSKVQQELRDDWTPVGGIAQIEESGMKTVVQAMFRLWK